MIRIWCYRIAFSVLVFALGAEVAQGGERTVSARGEETRFQTAERLFRQRRYPQADEEYRQILTIHEGGRHQKQIIERLYAIALYWLQDSWEQLKQVQEFGSPDWLLWFYPHDIYSEVLPNTRDIFRQTLSLRHVFHWDNTKPFLCQEGRAVGILQLIYKRDRRGPYADKALFLMGHIGWFREDYRQADECFSRLHKEHPDSNYDRFAVELAIKAKLMQLEEDEGKSPRIIEAKKMTIELLRDEGVSEEKKRTMLPILSTINARLAYDAFKAAEERQLAGDREQAYSQYAFVRHEYPGTSAALQATERMMILRPKLPKNFKLTPLSRSGR